MRPSTAFKFPSVAVNHPMAGGTSSLRVKLSIQFSPPCGCVHPEGPTAEANSQERRHQDQQRFLFDDSEPIKRLIEKLSGTARSKPLPRDSIVRRPPGTDCSRDFVVMMSIPCRGTLGAVHDGIRPSGARSSRRPHALQSGQIRLSERKHAAKTTVVRVR